MNLHRLQRILPAVGICLGFCSCATPNPSPLPLPPETTFNLSASQGDWLFVSAHLQDGKELVFLVDTGMPWTVFDRSLEPLLGKCLGTRHQGYEEFDSAMVRTYQAPQLYLGDTRLRLWKQVITEDLSRLLVTDYKDSASFQQPISGILGLDCLKNYCLQLDFTAGKMRFLDPDHLATNDLGRAFPLLHRGGRFYIIDSLAGTWGTNSWIDTGSPNDGTLTPELFDQAIQQKGTKTKKLKLPNGEISTVAQLPA
ncbi:MAG TPA: hypothetical protein VGO57_02475, partial [Verrucomicrobiae bacterium]